MSEEPLDPGAPDEAPLGETVYLGAFPTLEIPVIVALLDEHGIRAMPKDEVGRRSTFGYDAIASPHSMPMLVEKDRAAEARTIIDRDLPRRLHEIAQEMAEMAGEDPLPQFVEPAPEPVRREPLSQPGGDRPLAHQPPPSLLRRMLRGRGRKQRPGA